MPDLDALDQQFADWHTGLQHAKSIVTYPPFLRQLKGHYDTIEEGIKSITDPEDVSGIYDCLLNHATANELELLLMHLTMRWPGLKSDGNDSSATSDSDDGYFILQAMTGRRGRLGFTFAGHRDEPSNVACVVIGLDGRFATQEEDKRLRHNIENLVKQGRLAFDTPKEVLYWEGDDAEGPSYGTIATFVVIRPPKPPSELA